MNDELINGFKNIRMVDNFYQTSSFFPMPTTLIATLDTGQYDVNWKNVHMTPKESVNAALDLNATYAMPIHYGAFKLANHPWDDPLEGFTSYANKNNVNYVTPMIGEIINYKNISDYKNNWWKNIK